MLKATLLPEKTSPALTPYLLTARKEIVEVLKRLRQSGVTVTCFIQGGFIPAEARIDAILPAADILVLVAVSEVEHGLLSVASAISVVAFLNGVKIQFSAVANGSVAISKGIGIRVSMPTEVLRLQRRAHDRVKPSRIRPLECMVRGETNQPSLHRLTVLDIGVGGAALLAHAHDTYVAGQRLLNCSFDLAEDGEFTTDLIVRHVERVDGSGGWRYGCAYAHITPRALERVCCYVERIEAQRRSTLSMGT